jgi:hypothetical protein
MKLSITLTLIILTVLLPLAGCGEGGNIDRYQEAPAATTAAAPPASGQQMPSGHPPLSGDYSWQAPEGWESQPPSSMRIGSYLVPHGDQQGDLSVIRLAGTAGGPLNNLNRWRGQLGLEPVAEDATEAAGREVESPVGTFTCWTLVNGEPVNKGMLVGMLFAGDHSLFVKMTGSPELVNAVEEQFTSYLESFTRAEGS